eukprot:tig00000655_g2877.t1
MKHAIALEQLHRERLNRFERRASIPLKDVLNQSLNDASRIESDDESDNSEDIEDVYEELAKSEQIVGGRVVVNYSPGRLSRSRSRSAAPSAAATPLRPAPTPVRAAADRTPSRSEAGPASARGASPGRRRAHFAGDDGSDSDGFLDFVMELNRKAASSSSRRGSGASGSAEWAEQGRDEEAAYRQALRDIYGDDRFHVLSHHSHHTHAARAPSPGPPGPPHASPSFLSAPAHRSPAASPLRAAPDESILGYRTDVGPSTPRGFPSAAEALSFAATGRPAPSPARPPRSAAASAASPAAAARAGAPEVGAALEEIRRQLSDVAALVRERRPAPSPAPAPPGPSRPSLPADAPHALGGSGGGGRALCGRHALERGVGGGGPGEGREGRWLEHAERHLAASEERLRRALQRRIDDEARRTDQRWRRLEEQVRKSAEEAAAAWRTGGRAAQSLEQLEASNRLLRAELARLARTPLPSFLRFRRLTPAQQRAIARGGRPRADDASPSSPSSAPRRREPPSYAYAYAYPPGRSPRAARARAGVARPARDGEGGAEAGGGGAGGEDVGLGGVEGQGPGPGPGEAEGVEGGGGGAQARRGGLLLGPGVLHAGPAPDPVAGAPRTSE